MAFLRENESHWRSSRAVVRKELAALLILAAMQGGTLKAREPSTHQISAQTVSASHAGPPLIIELKPSAQEVEAEAERQSAERRIIGLQPDGWVAIFTFFLTVSTAFLWKETRHLARGAEDQSEKMVESIAEAGRAATAMEGVAKNMAANVKSATEIGERQALQLRAYMFPNSGNRLTGAICNPPHPKRANEPLLLLEIKNSGPTPAYKVNTWAWISVIESSREDTLTVPPMPKNNRSSLAGYQSMPKILG